MYQTEYRRKLLATPEKAAALVKENDLLIHGTIMAEPPALLQAVAARLRQQDLRRLRVFSFAPQRHACEPVLAVDLVDCVESSTGFVAGERAMVRTGLDYFIPNHFHQLPRLIREFMEVDVVMTMVSPMDKAGYFSFGTANDIISTAARCAKLLVVEVNEHMPRVFGDSLLHISEVDAVVENHAPLDEALPGPTKPEDPTIARTIAEMIPDGATIQLGVGNLPEAVGYALTGHKDLGIHTEAFGPAMVELIIRGAVTGCKKNLHTRKHVFALAKGGKEMLEFMDDNPAMESYPASYTNHPAIIARHDNMISVNAAIEVDLTGQCNAEHLGGWQFSGSGGQLDFVRGAFDSKGGRSIIAIRSTAKNGKVSSIVPRLSAGTMVTTPRMDLHYLVTENGAANLKGKSTRERALAITELAHPRFREDLLREAETMYLL